MTTQTLETYIDYFAAFNDVPPQLEKFLKGLRPLNKGEVCIKNFTFQDKYYALMVPVKFFEYSNFTQRMTKFLIKSLVKKDITLVSVYELMDIATQIFGYSASLLSTYKHLSTTYHDKCRHTVVKYYSLNNPK